MFFSGEEDDWQSVSERNHNTRSSSENDANPGYVTAHDVSAADQPSTSGLHLALNPPNPVDMLESLDGGFGSHRFATHVTLVPQRNPVPLINGGGENTSSDLENCDDLEITALRK